MSEAILNCFCQTTTLYRYDNWRFRMKIFEHRFTMVRNGQLGQKTRLWLCLNLVLNARPKEFLSIIQFILPSKKHSFEISIGKYTIMKKWNVLSYHWVNRIYNNFITLCSLCSRFYQEYLVSLIWCKVAIEKWKVFEYCSERIIVSFIKKKHQKHEQAENWKWLRYIRGSFFTHDWRKLSFV